MHQDDCEFSLHAHANSKLEVFGPCFLLNTKLLVDPLLRVKADAAQGQCWVNVKFWGGVIPGNTQHLTHMVNMGVPGREYSRNTVEIQYKVQEIQ